jgi:hypothetical protein
LRTLSTEKHAQTGEVSHADRIYSDQVFEILAVLSNPETAAFWQDWMVGDAGIEPATPPV